VQVLTSVRFDDGVAVLADDLDQIHEVDLAGAVTVALQAADLTVGVAEDQLPVRQGAEPARQVDRVALPVRQIVLVEADIEKRPASIEADARWDMTGNQHITGVQAAVSGFDRLIELHQDVLDTAKSRLRCRTLVAGVSGGLVRIQRDRQIAHGAAMGAYAVPTLDGPVKQKGIAAWHATEPPPLSIEKTASDMTLKPTLASVTSVGV